MTAPRIVITAREITFEGVAPEFRQRFVYQAARLREALAQVDPPAPDPENPPRA